MLWRLGSEKKTAYPVSLLDVSILGWRRLCEGARHIWAWKKVMAGRTGHGYKPWRLRRMSPWDVC